jgi:hypothetical protein
MEGEDVSRPLGMEGLDAIAESPRRDNHREEREKCHEEQEGTLAHRS